MRMEEQEMCGPIVMIKLHKVYERYVQELMKQAFNEISAVGFESDEVDHVFFAVNAKYLSEALKGTGGNQFRKWKGVDVVITSGMRDQDPPLSQHDLNLSNGRALITPELLAHILYVVSFSRSLLLAQGYAANPLRFVSDSGPLNHTTSVNDTLIPRENTNGFIFYLNALTPRMLELIRTYLSHLSELITTITTQSMLQGLISSACGVPWSDELIAYTCLNLPCLMQAALALYTGGTIQQRFHDRPAFMLETVVHPVLRSFATQVMSPLFLVRQSSHSEALNTFNLSDEIILAMQSDPLVKRLITLANVSRENSYGFSVLNILVDELKRQEDESHAEEKVLAAVESLGSPENSHFPWFDTARCWTHRPSAVRVSLLLDVELPNSVLDKAWPIARELSVKHEGPILSNWNIPNTQQSLFLWDVKRWVKDVYQSRGFEVREGQEEVDKLVENICMDVSTRGLNAVERMLMNRLSEQKPDPEPSREEAIRLLNEQLERPADQQEDNVACLYLRLARAGYRPVCRWVLTRKDLKKILARRRGWGEIVAAWEGDTGQVVAAKRQKISRGGGTVPVTRLSGRAAKNKQRGSSSTEVNPNDL
eukprot:GHVN01079562.1.p2 GENE.GHVN01079562.1~~GHVN01079562.1.p2  ORF type:complete len:595 (+),score=35.20 GHVN01079562.1:2599-4383(+)